MPHRVQSIRSSVKNTRPATNSREPGELFVNFADRQIGYIDAAKAPVDLVAIRFFSNATNYSAGDFVIQANTVYKANTAVVAGAFNPTQWDSAPTTGQFEPPIAAGLTTQYWRGDKTWALLDKSAVGLGAVDNTSDANKPVSTAQAAADATKANIASPTFTGDPKAPTASPGDNDTSIATTAFVTAAVAVSDAAQASADALKANIASPTFTGNPTAPTPSPGDADTSIATTAFVSAAISGSGYLTDAPADGLVYGRKNNLWATVIGGAHTDDLPPGAPLQDGQLWWQSSTGRLFIWYVDVDSSAWIQVNGPPPLTGTAETRNRVVNPLFAISQENGVTASGVTSYYIADQWVVGAVHGGVHSAQSLATGPNRTGGRLLCTTIDAAVAAGDELGFGQRIEGLDLLDFWWGQPTARPAVARFTAWSLNAGTYAFSIRNHALDTSFVSTFTLPAGVWTEVVIPIPACTIGTWPIDNTRAAFLTFTVMSGTTSQTPTLNAWVAGPYSGHASVSNFMSTVNNDFRVSAVGLYRDPNNTGVPPPWEDPDYAADLAKCQRYWQNDGLNVPIISAIAAAAGQTMYGNATGMFKTTMRVAPSIAFSSISYGNASALSLNATSVQSIRCSATTGGAGASYAIFTWAASARM